jgi:hypothetical protein
MLCLTQQHACKTFLIYVDKYLAIQFKCMRHFVHTHFDEKMTITHILKNNPVMDAIREHPINNHKRYVMM